MRTFILLAITFFYGTASAQTNDCTTLKDDVARLRCYDSAKTTTASPPDPFIATAKAAIIKQLRDPSSARFQGIKVKTVDAKRGVCGTVNAKNAAGGMTGPQLFVYDGKNANVLVLSDGPDNPTSFQSNILALIFKRGSDNYDLFCK